MEENRDTTNSCSQCEAYAKRIEELTAEVEQLTAELKLRTKQFENIKEHLFNQGEIARKKWELMKADKNSAFERIHEAQDLHNSSMSAKVAGELRAELDIEYLTSLPLAEDNIGDDVVNANRVDDAITDSTDKEASDVCDD